MQILLMIILLVIGILTLTGLFFFSGSLIIVFYDLKKWLASKWKKILAIFITTSVVAGGWMLIEPDMPAPLNEVPNNILIWNPVPVNSFGSAGYYEIDADVHFEYFNNHTKWKLLHSNDGKEWNIIEGLDITSIFDRPNISEKVILNFTALKDGYYNIQYSVDTYVKAYKREETDYIIKLEFPIENKSGSYVTYFDWTDIIETKAPVHYSYGFLKKDKYDYFQFTIVTDYLESGTFMSIDPTFGSTSEESTTQSTKDIIVGLKGSQPSSDGDVDDITIRILEGEPFGTRNWKACIYNSAGNKITNGETDEMAISQTAATNYIFTYTTKPSVTASTDYYLVVWCDGSGFGAGQTYYSATGSNTFVTKTGLDYVNDGFPASIGSWTTTDTSADAYFSASMSGGDPPWSNTAPTITGSSENPPDTQTAVQKELANFSSHFNITVADVNEANQSINVTWRTNESGAWNDMGYNESATCNATYYCTNVSWVDEYSTTYYWSVNVSDNATTKGWVNATYSFTTESAPPNDPPINSEFTPNNATDISLNPTIYVTVNDPEGDTINVTISTNASGTWVDKWWHNNTNNGTKSNATGTTFDTYDTKYWYNISTNDGMGNWDNDTRWFSTREYISNTYIDAISPYTQTSSPATITATNDGDPSDNLTLYYRFSPGNESWLEDTANHNTTFYNINFSYSIGVHDVIWRAKILDDEWQEARPVIEDGILYISSNNYGDGNMNHTYAIYTNNGTIKWNTTDTGFTWGGGAIDSERVFTTYCPGINLDGAIRCLDKETGEYLWNYTIPGGVAEAPLVGDTDVYVAGSKARDPKGTWHAINKETGALNWTSSDNFTRCCFLSMLDDNIIYYCRRDNVSVPVGDRFNALNISDAGNPTELLWSVPLNASTYDTLVLGGINDSCLFIASGEYLKCINKSDGSEYWHIHVFPSGIANQVGFTYYNNRIYCYWDEYSVVYAVNITTHNIDWSYNISLLEGYTIDSHMNFPTYLGDGVLVVGTDDEIGSGYYGLDADTGDLLSIDPLRHNVVTSPAIVDGKLYTCSDTDYFYCFDFGLGDEGDWKSVRYDANNSGYNPNGLTSHKYITVSVEPITGENTHAVNVTNHYTYNITGFTLTGFGTYLDWFNYSSSQLLSTKVLSYSIPLMTAGQTKSYKIINVTEESGSPNDESPSHTQPWSWHEWGNSSNPDTSPFSWNFDFPNGTGYYEFYSTAKKSGETTESAPGIGDAICYFNTSIQLNTTIRTDGVDYFVWLGSNQSAWHAKDAIGATFNESGETISILNNTGHWDNYTGAGGGNNFSIHTFDVVKIVLDDGAGTLTFNMTPNSNIDYDAARTVTLTKVGNGYNFTGWTNSTSTTLSAENTTLGLTTGYFIALWNETNYNWDYWISGFGINNKNIHQYDVVMTKIATTKSNWQVG